MSLMLLAIVLVSTPTFLARVHVFLYWFFVYKQHGICGIWQILLLLSMSKCYWSLNVISKWVAMVKTKFGSMLIKIQDSMKVNIVGLWYNLNYEHLLDVKLFESQNTIVIYYTFFHAHYACPCEKPTIFWKFFENSNNCTTILQTNVIKLYVSSKIWTCIIVRYV